MTINRDELKRQRRTLAIVMVYPWEKMEDIKCHNQHAGRPTSIVRFYLDQQH